MSEPVETPRRKLTGAAAPALAAAALAGLGALLIVGRMGEGAPAEAAPEGCILEHADALGGALALVDASGAPVTQADFAGAPAVVYFGYTSCAEACPITMYALAEALAAPAGYDIQPILISTDPVRDTPERMAAYAVTDGFPPGLVGLTGSREQIAAAARAFKVDAQSPADSIGPADQFAHSSLLYVLDGQWRTVSAMRTVRRENAADPQSPSVAVSPDEIARCIALGLERGAPGGERS